MSNNVEIIINARDNASKNIRGVSDSLSTFQRGVGGLVRAIGPLTAAMGGMAIATKKGWDALKQGAELELTRERFDRLTESIGTTADAMLTKLQSATQGMVSDAELMASAGQIISLGLADTEDGVVRLANLISQLGWDMQQVILTFANNSKMRLDALGLSVEDVTKRAEALAETGMSMDQAFDLAVIEAGEEKLRLLGSAAETTAGQMQMLEADIKNVMDSLKAGFAERLSPLFAAASGRNADQVRQQTQALIDQAESVERLGEMYLRFREQQFGVGETFTGTTDAFRDAAEAAKVAAAQQAGSFEEFAAALGIVGDSFRDTAYSASEFQEITGGSIDTLRDWYEMQQRIIAAEPADQLFANYREKGQEAAEAINTVAEEIEEYGEKLKKIEQDELLDDLEVTERTFAGLVVELGSVAAAYDYLAKVQADVAQGGGAYEVSADQVSAANEEMEQSAQEAAEAARELAEQIASIGQGAARENFGVLEDLAQARRDLAEASGVWVQAERDTSAEIAEINAQLANDLTDKEKKQWEERLDIIEEGSQEYINRARRLEEDLTEAQRRELILRRAELQAQMGEPISLFTGDLKGMEEAQEKIAELEAALRENLVDALLEAQEAAGGFGEGTIDLRLALGLIDEETADAERAMLRVSQAVADLGAAVGSGAVSPESASMLFDALLEAASGTELELQTIMDRIYAVINGDMPATASDPRLTGENLKNRMLAEVEGLPAELAEEGATAGSALKEGMLPEIEEVEERIIGLAGVAAANPVNIESNALSVAGDIETLKATLLGLDGLTVTTTVNTVGGGAGGGGAGSPGAEVFAAGGADFFVPPGFPADSFSANLHLTSGERVTVTPPGQGGGMGGGVYAPSVTVFASSILNNPHALAGRVSQSLSNMGNRGR